VTPGGRKSEQDEDRRWAIDQSWDSDGVFACRERPDCPDCGVAENDPVSRRRDAVEMLDAYRADGLWD
jgi:hypothetical protein